MTFYTSLPHESCLRHVYLFQVIQLYKAVYVVTIFEPFICHESKKDEAVSLPEKEDKNQ